MLHDRELPFRDSLLYEQAEVDVCPSAGRDILYVAAFCEHAYTGRNAGTAKDARPVARVYMPPMKACSVEFEESPTSLLNQIANALKQVLICRNKLGRGRPRLQVEVPAPSEESNMVSKRSIRGPARPNLFDHVKAQHIDPIAWKLGDGPSVPAAEGSETSATGRWRGRTPAKRGEKIRLSFPASHSSIRAFDRVHKKNSLREKADKILKAVQRLKERIGVGLDPGECELATPSRNQRVSNDEEVVGAN